MHALARRVALACAALGVPMVVGACRARDAAPKATPPSSATAVGPSSAAAASPAVSAASAHAIPTSALARLWSFDADDAGSAPTGFSFGRTGGGREGTWLVRPDPGAPSGPNVLGQTSADSTDDRFPLAFTNDIFPADVEVGVKCKLVSGNVDRACGLVLRLKGASDYYLTRANALESNVRLYFVKDGRRRQIGSWSGAVTSAVWHDYRFVARGDHFEVHWDGVKVLDEHDATFTDGGHVGVWTKADSVTYFDDLRARVAPAGDAP